MASNQISIYWDFQGRERSKNNVKSSDLDIWEDNGTNQGTKTDIVKER